jgi:shikimate dehydrogenase
VSGDRQATPAISGTTRLLGIVGDPIAQVGSPRAFNARLAAAGADAVLVPFHVPAAAFEQAMPGLMRLRNLDGILVTIPFKERALALADTVLPAAAQVGAANALRREPDGRWTADMFDGVGLLRALAGLGVAAEGAAVLLLGAGGAGRAIAISLARAGAARIGLCDLDSARATALAARVRAAYPHCTASEVAPRADGYGIVINATPVGMAPGDGLPAPLGPLERVAAVIDIVPKAAVTPLLAAAAAAGCRVAGGQAMIEGQAEEVLAFFGILPPATPRGG